MSTQFETAREGIEKSWQSGQLAHAWLLQGAPHGAALRFTEQMLNLIFNNHPQIQTHSHPDLVWIEPQSKSRRIGIDEIRDMIRQLSQTSFSGGWKAGVLLGADRLTPEASNAFLKTLEEPSAKTLLILVTDEPQSLLPTITSRCQRIVLTDEDGQVSREWKEPLLELLRNLPPHSVPEAVLAAGRLAAMLKELYGRFETEEGPAIPEDLPAKESKVLLEARATARTIEARTEILRTILQWQRDVLLLVLEQNGSALHFPEDKESLARQAVLCTRADALRRVAAVEEMGRQFDRNLPAELVFNNFFSQLI